jgi:pimeloyl-ACP methyl ester carboxylesterase
MDLHYKIMGNGKPIVLHHTGGSDSRVWKFLAPLLAKHFKVIIFDGRGAGKSPSPVGPVNYVEELLHLLDHLEIDQATLLGHSMGGQIATEFALLYPNRVTELVLVAPSLSGYPYSTELAQYFQRIQSASPDIDKMIEIALNAPIYQVTIAGPHRDLLVQMMRHHIEKTSEWKSFEQIWPQTPAIEKLGEMEVKTLFIIGEIESSDNKRVAKCFQEVPNIRFVPIASADHMVMLTHASEIYRCITSFLEE